MEDIKILREKIDRIDLLIISLFEERFEISKKIGDYKKKNGLKINDEERERQVLQKICSQIKDVENIDNIKNIYKTIFSESKKRQI